MFNFVRILYNSVKRTRSPPHIDCFVCIQATKEVSNGLTVTLDRAIRGINDRLKRVRFRTTMEGSEQTRSVRVDEFIPARNCLVF